MIKDLERKFNKDLGTKRLSWMQVIDVLKKREVENSVIHNFVTEIDFILMGFDKGLNSLQAIQDYCAFFDSSMTRFDEIDEACKEYIDSPKANKLLALDKNFKKAIEFIQWVKDQDDLNVNSDYYDEIRRRADEFNNSN